MRLPVIEQLAAPGILVQDRCNPLKVNLLARAVYAAVQIEEHIFLSFTVLVILAILIDLVVSSWCG